MSGEGEEKEGVGKGVAEYQQRPDKGRDSETSVHCGSTSVPVRIE